MVVDWSFASDSVTLVLLPQRSSPEELPMDDDRARTVRPIFLRPIVIVLYCIVVG